MHDFFTNIHQHPVKRGCIVFIPYTIICSNSCIRGKNNRRSHAGLANSVYLSSDRKPRCMKIAFPLLLVVLFACGPSPEKTAESSAVKASDKDSTVAATPPEKELPPVPELIAFRQSDCKDDCGRDEKIVFQKLKGDTLHLRVSKILSCSTPYDASIQEHSSVRGYIPNFGFKVSIRPRIEKRRDGSIDSVIVSTECDCLYFLDFKVKHVNDEPGAIRINGKLFHRDNEIRSDIQLR